MASELDRKAMSTWKDSVSYAVRDCADAVAEEMPTPLQVLLIGSGQDNLAVLKICQSDSGRRFCRSPRRLRLLFCPRAGTVTQSVICTEIRYSEAQML